MVNDKVHLVVPRVVPRDSFDNYLSKIQQRWQGSGISVVEANEDFIDSYDYLEVLHHKTPRFSWKSLGSILAVKGFDHTRVLFVVPFIENSFLEYINMIRLEKSLGVSAVYLNDRGEYFNSFQMRNRFLEAHKRLKSDKRKLRSLKGKFQGQRCFVLGNGPSLAKIDLAKLKGEYTFGSNGIFYAFEKIGKPTSFYTVEDELCAKDNYETILSMPDVDFMFFPLRLYPYFHSLPKAIFVNYSPSTKNERNFSDDPSRIIYSGYTVVYLNLQIAKYLGFSRIYTLGIDLSYNYNTESDSIKFVSNGVQSNHFSPDYYKNGHHWWRPEVEQMVISLQKAQENIENHGSKIINATPGGNLNFFERLDFESLF